MKPGTKYSDYDELYAHYALIDAIGHRINQTRGKTAKQPMIDRVVEIAHAALALVPAPGSIWHFTDEGAFQEEVTRKAANAVAWFQMERAKSDADLDAALVTIGRALSVARSQDDYVRDTQVRILMKLRRKDEAFAIADRVLREDPDATDFQDIKRDAAYAKWKSSQP
jgi:hypothetical protein